MIELENDWISLATVNARVSAQVLDQIHSVALAIPRLCVVAPLVMRFSILGVVLFEIRRHTWLAIRPNASAIASAELSQGQLNFAFWAAFCFITT